MLPALDRRLTSGISFIEVGRYCTPIAPKSERRSSKRSSGDPNPVMGLNGAWRASSRRSFSCSIRATSSRIE